MCLHILHYHVGGYIIARPPKRQTSTAHSHAAEAQGCSNASTCTGWLTNLMCCTKHPGCDCRCSRCCSCRCCCCSSGSETCSISAVSSLHLPATAFSRLPLGCRRSIVTLAGKRDGRQSRKTTTAQGFSVTNSAAVARIACHPMQPSQGMQTRKLVITTENYFRRQRHHQR